MSHKRRQIKEDEVQGLKYFKAISGMLESLRQVGCERDRAGNRILHMDQYVSLLLLHLFNPICTSLRSLQQASELKKVQRKLGVPRASLGSLSEAATVFDSEAMLQIIGQLGAQLKPIATHGKLNDLPGILTAVDGTLLKGLPKIAWALWVDDKHRAVKNHVHFEILKGVPVKATVTAGNANEKDVLAETLESGRIYVLDRGYAKYSLLQTIRDRVMHLGVGPKSHDLTAPVRVVEVTCTPHRKRGHTGRGGPEQSETLAIATDLMEVDADVIALIFQYRWTIEIFFRFYKHVLGCRHLLSYTSNGIELQTYAAIIACMLIALWTGRKPTLRTYEMLCWYFTGMADEEELLAHINRLQKTA